MTSTERRAGRPRNAALDGGILDAVRDVLGDVGYERMTVDLVAARAGAARATVYRRWPTKLDLVIGALAALGPADADPRDAPDTGSLRGDLLAASRFESPAEQQRRVRIVSGLQAAARTEPRLAAAIADDGLQPWIESSRALIRRAIDRGEFPSADVDALAQVVPLMCACRVAVQGLPVTAEYATGLIDGVLLPALRASRACSPD